MKWNVTISIVSTLPAEDDEEHEPVEMVWCRGGDELSALQSVIQNMQSVNDRFVKVTKITVEPAPEDQTPNAQAYIGAG